VEADGNLSPTDAPQPHLAPHPLSARSRSAPLCILPETRRPLRLQPSHRSHARDGPHKRAGARPTAGCSGTTPKPSPIAPRGCTNHASNPLERPPGSSAVRVGATDRRPARACEPEPRFFTPQALTTGHSDAVRRAEAAEILMSRVYGRPVQPSEELARRPARRACCARGVVRQAAPADLGRLSRKIPRENADRSSSTADSDRERSGRDHRSDRVDRIRACGARRRGAGARSARRDSGKRRLVSVCSCRS
jgi:hypothetical protein